MSLTGIDPGRVLADDVILRTNNFFFETEFYLGPRVDLAVMAGDPRVAPFMFETLWRCRRDYDLRGWTSFNPKVIRAGMRRFRDQYKPLQIYRDGHVERALQSLIEKYQRVPTTGAYAALIAHATGAQDIIFAGFDLYNTGKRYPFEPGRHYRDLMGEDLNDRGLDRHLHHADLDRAVLEMLAARDDVRLSRAADCGPLDDMMPLAPLRPGLPLATGPRTSPPTDWAASSGLYPIALLKALRRVSRWHRRFFKE